MVGPKCSDSAGGGTSSLGPKRSGKLRSAVLLLEAKRSGEVGGRLLSSTTNRRKTRGAIGLTSLPHNHYSSRPKIIDVQACVTCVACPVCLACLTCLCLPLPGLHAWMAGLTFASPGLTCPAWLAGLADLAGLGPGRRAGGGRGRGRDCLANHRKLRRMKAHTVEIVAAVAVAMADSVW